MTSRSILTCTWIAFVFSAFATALFAKTAGVYSVDRSDPYAPVEVYEDVTKDKPYLRDPSSEIKALPKLPAKKQSSAKAQLSFDKKTHAFKPAKITGQLRVPRVQFEQQVLEVQRVPDRLSKGFLDKPFEASITDY